MTRSFSQRAVRGLTLIVGLLAILLPQFASAGTCMEYCSRAVSTGLQPGENTYTEVVPQPGPSCTLGAQCTDFIPPACDTGFTRGTQYEALYFCQKITPLTDASGQPNPYHHLVAGLTWCTDLLNPGRATATDATTPPDGRCVLTSAEIDTRNRAAAPAQVHENLNGAAHPTVSGTPPPQPANPGDTFRCRFLCSSDTAQRDGRSCAAASDSATCLTECNTVCRASGETCLGASASNANSDQAPLCVAVVPPAASVAGLTDTGQFETIHEAVTNISIPVFIGKLVKALLGVAGALFFAMLVWGGLRWMTAGGDPGAVKAAMSITKNAIIGVVIIALSYTIVTAFMQIVSQFAN